MGPVTFNRIVPQLQELGRLLPTSLWVNQQARAGRRSFEVMSMASSGGNNHHLNRSGTALSQLPPLPQSPQSPMAAAAPDRPGSPSMALRQQTVGEDMHATLAFNIINGSTAGNGSLAGNGNAASTASRMGSRQILERQGSSASALLESFEVTHGLGPAAFSGQGRMEALVVMGDTAPPGTTTPGTAIPGAGRPPPGPSAPPHQLQHQQSGSIRTSIAKMMPRSMRTSLLAAPPGNTQVGRGRRSQLSR